MAIEFIGVKTSDPGPRGLVARFIETSAANDEDAARAMLTEGSREGFDIDAAAFGESTVRFGEVESEDDHFLVPTNLQDAEGENEMPFVVREEGGELRIDFDATLEKLMGVSPDEFMDDLAASIGADEADVADVADVAAPGATTPGMPKSEDAEPCEAGEWHLPPASTAKFRETIIETATSLGGMFFPPFMPFPDLLDSEEWEPEGSRIVTTRHGSETAGYRCVDTVVKMEAQETHVVDVTAYGMSEDQMLRLVWSRSADGDEPPVETALIQVSAPSRTHQHIGMRLEFDFGWKDPAAANDDW